VSIVDSPYEESYPPSLWTPPAPPPLATGATAGIPGTWTPPGSTVPASVAALQASSITALPVMLWTVGQYVQTLMVGAPGRAYWNGTAWVGGAAPVAQEPPEEPEP
jgi:hypothetical protein